MTQDKTVNPPPDGNIRINEMPIKEKFQLGERLQAIRKSRGLSQRELARRAGITNGSLSLIEQGKVSPSFQSLEKIIAAIPMTLIEFFDAKHRPLPIVVTQQELDQIDLKGATIKLLSLDFLGLSDARLAELRLEAGGQCRPDGYAGIGTLCGLLVSGDLELELSGAVYRVLAGEFFRFDVRQDHRFINVGTTCACAVILVCSA